MSLCALIVVALCMLVEPVTCAHSDVYLSEKQLNCLKVLPDSCAPGLFYNSTTGRCECGVYPDRIIKCNGTRLFVEKYYCATYVDQKHALTVGGCRRYFNPKKTRKNNAEDTLYHLLPRRAEQLNNATCKPTQRTGILCGRCLPGHYPLAYAFGMSCVPCPDNQWNWLKYIAAAYLPLTLFYILVVCFKLNTTSSHLFAVIYFCQTLSIPMYLRGIMLEISSDTTPAFENVSKLLMSLYAVWNLDFFRPFYSNLRLGIGILPTLALDYAVAVYPLLLVLITYILIVMYNKNYRVVMQCSILSADCWNVKTSVIDAFATFFFLSNIKFMSVSLDLLVPTQVFWLYPDHYNTTLGLFYAGDIEYFGTEHLPYAILAIVVLLVFVLLPVLLLALYPFAFFQKFLNHFPFRWYILHTFVDSFYGCYKDGTQPGTCDCRSCASVYFFMRVLQLALFFIAEKNIYLFIVTLILIVCTTLIASIQPFKSIMGHHNIIHVAFLQGLVMFSIINFGVSYSVINAPQYETFFFAMGIIIGTIALLYLIASFVHWLYKHNVFSFSRLKAWRSGYANLSGSNHLLPHRIENSAEYPTENLAAFPAQN